MNVVQAFFLMSVLNDYISMAGVSSVRWLEFFYIVFFRKLYFTVTSCFLQGWEKGKVTWLFRVVMSKKAS